VIDDSHTSLGVPERAEESCLDAEAWASELEDWVNGHLHAAPANDMKTLAQMLRALVKSIRLSIVADETDENRAYLVEELESTMAHARSLAAGIGQGGPTERRGVPRARTGHRACCGLLETCRPRPPPPEGVGALDHRARAPRSPPCSGSCRETHRPLLRPPTSAPAGRSPWPTCPPPSVASAFARDVMQRTSPISDLPLPPSPKKKKP
jgi:hypothetical protein